MFLKREESVKMLIYKSLFEILVILILVICTYFEKKADRESSKKSILKATICAICGIIIINFIYPKMDEMLSRDTVANESNSINNEDEKHFNNRSANNEKILSSSNEEDDDNILDDDSFDISNEETLSDISDSKSGSKRLCDLKVESNNDRFNQIESSDEIDTLGNIYVANNLFQLNTYGESIWGEYGYSEDRRAFGIYDIGYRFESMSGTIAVSDKTSNEKVCARLEILGDKKVLEYYDLQRNTEPIKFEINDIANVDKLEFNLVYRSVDGAGDVYVLLSDIMLKESTVINLPEENENIQKLSNMKVVNSNENFEMISTHSMTDILGNVYSPDNLFELKTYGESIWGNYGYSEDNVTYGEFYLDQQYQELNGVISVSDNTKDENVGGIFVIYDEDHQEIYHKKLDRNSEPMKIERLNVSGKKWIRFELRFHAEDGAGNFLLLMSDFEFTQ